jgi:short subunit dehydrogenase-like uncharacterized protein
VTEREHDVVVLGATGFTGGHVARWFRRHAPTGLRWAIAGRNAEKLARLGEEIGAGVPRIVVDVEDERAVDRMAASTKVVCNLAGPYGRYGTPVVAACARHGTDHTDLTGETPWVRSLIDELEPVAQRSGARIVPFAGFDSIPSELGAWSVARHCRDALGQGCGRVDAGFALSGGLSGGTFASAVDLADPSFGRPLSDPFLLDPPDVRDQRDRKAHRDPRDVAWSDDFGEWLGPFFMAPTNTRVVRRSAALLAAAGRGYGDGFAYQEQMRFRSRLRAHAVRLAVGGLFAALRNPTTRGLAIRLGPKSGDGPKDVTKGGFRAIFIGHSDDGTRVRAEVSASGDPGYGVTPRLIGAASVLLATERASLPATPGVRTPAAAFDHRLPDLARLADVSVDVATAN